MPTTVQTSEITQFEAPAAQAPGASSAQLTMLVGAQIGHVYPLTLPIVTLGRGREAGLRLPHSSVSRAHAVIRQLEDGRYELEDLGSANGTLVNGQRLNGRRVLQSGDRVRLGPRILLQFAIIDHFDRRIREIERLETVSQLSAAVNHDLNNLLTVLTCGISFLSTLDPNTRLSTADVVECLKDMELAATKAGELTQRMNTLARQPEKAINERVDLSELCDEVVRMLKRIVPSGIKLEPRIAPNLRIEGNRAWIHQLLMNPCINARDAMSDRGSLRIEARTATAVELAEHPELLGASFALVTIADTGRGIPPEIISRVFQPFFTTKGAGKGTGLGLATVARVAKEHGGAVYLSSEVGVGTTIRIFLPQSEQRASQREPEAEEFETSVREVPTGTHARTDGEPSQKMASRGGQNLLESARVMFASNYQID